MPYSIRTPANSPADNPAGLPLAPIAPLRTFADVDRFIDQHPGWPPATRGSLRALCRRSAWSVQAIDAAQRGMPFEADVKALDLAGVAFDIAWINAAWKGRTYRAAGFASQKSFVNARSAIRRVGRAAGMIVAYSTAPIETGDAFAPLLRTANRYEAANVRLFIAWCRQASLIPDNIDDAMLGVYEAYMLTHMVGRETGKIIRLLARLWNDTARCDPHWPQTPLSAPRLSAPYTLPLTDYPASFQADVAALLAWMAGTRRRAAPGERAGRKLALRPATIENSRRLIRQAAWALIEGGREPASLTDLGCLVTAPAMEAILDYYEARGRAQQQARPAAERVANARGTTATTQTLGARLLMIARHYCVVPAETLDKLKALERDFRLPLMTRPTARNRQRVDQFLNDRAMLQTLMRLPATLLDEALALRAQAAEVGQQAVQANSTETAEQLTHTASGLTRQAAHLAREATLIGILCRIPLRIKNLHAIRIGTHLRFAGGSADSVTLCFTEAETKNHSELEFFVGARLHGRLRTYITLFLPFFADGSTDFAEQQWLFPSGGGRAGPTSIGRLREAIERSVAENVGATIHPHLFRALAVTIALEHAPNAVEHCRKLLGDNSMTVILRHYAMMQAKAAAQRQSTFVDLEEDRLAVVPPPVIRRRGGRS